MSHQDTELFRRVRIAALVAIPLGSFFFVLAATYEALLSAPPTEAESGTGPISEIVIDQLATIPEIWIAIAIIIASLYLILAELNT